MSGKTSSFLFSPREDTVDVTIPWLLALRWGEMLCQIFLAVVVVLFMGIRISVLLVTLILIFKGSSNLYLHIHQKHNRAIANWIIVLILLLDIVFLTILLYVTGGVMNPFVLLYFIHIISGAIILHELWSWLITIITFFSYGLLYYFPPPVINDFSVASKINNIAGLHLIGGITGYFQLHLQGMWVAFVITSFFIVFFVSKVKKAFAEHRITLLTLEKEQIRNEKLSSLATLAASAVHELSTPLSTVAVTSNEMIHTLEGKSNNDELLSDAQLIRKQIAACKEILYQMAAGAGEHLGEEKRSCSVEEVVKHILKDFNEEQRQRIRVNIEKGIPAINIPFRSLCRTVKGLLINGIEASENDTEVSIYWFISSGKLYIKIMDQGIGIQENKKTDVTKPFFTTKKSGLGLGLFLAATLADQFKGTLEITSEPNQKTTVMMSLSLDLLIIEA